MASAVEVEMGGLYHNTQTSLPIRYILEALHHPQPPTLINTDNATAQGFIYNNINLKKSKSWDMRYYWARDRANQKQFKYTWDYGDQNEGDYYTKHYPTHHHRTMRPRYNQDKVNILYTNLDDIVSKLQGCVDTQYHRDN